MKNILRISCAQALCPKPRRFAPRLARLHPVFAAMLLAGCTPTVNVSADKPIEINMNIKIEHHVKVEIEKDVQKAIKNNKDIF